MKKIVLSLFVLAAISCSSDDNPTPEPTDPLKKEKELIVTKWPVEKYIRKEVKKDKVTGVIIQVQQPDGSYKDTVISEAAAGPGAYWDFQADEKIYLFDGVDLRDTADYRIAKEGEAVQIWIGNPERLHLVTTLNTSALTLSQRQNVETAGNTITETEYITYLKK